MDRAVDLLVSLAVGIVGSVLAGAWFQPILEQWTGYQLTFAMSWIAKRFGSRPPLEGSWRQIWHVQESLNYPETNSSDLTLHQFARFVCGDFTATSRNGGVCRYRLHGRMERGNFLTGIWYDRDGYGYFGSFKLRLHEHKEAASGQWLGSKQNTAIAAGPWEWRRDQAICASASTGSSVGECVRSST